jgi:hypothetical protein
MNIRNLPYAIEVEISTVGIAPIGGHDANSSRKAQPDCR